MEPTQLGDLRPEQWLTRVLLGAAVGRPTDLRELVPVVNGAGDAFDERTADEAASSVADSLAVAPERVAAITGWIDTMFAETAARLEAVDHEALDRAVAALDPLEVATDPFTAASPFIGPAMPEIDAEALAGIIGGLDDLKVASAYMSARQRTPRAHVLRRALFVTAVADIEPHMARLMPYLLFDREPGKYTSLGDPGLAKAARKACYGNPGDWHERLVDKLELDDLDRTIPWDALCSAWEDRNALHHRRGYVDTLDAVAAGVAVDTAADITTEYLYDTIDRVQVTMVALVLAASKRLAPGDLEELVTITVHDFASAYRDRRWPYALGLATIRAEYATSVDETESARVEQWLARSGAEGPAAVRDDVTGWQTRDLPPVYGVARDLLLGDDDTALTKLNALRAQGAVTESMIESSVIFDPIRDRL